MLVSSLVSPLISPNVGALLSSDSRPPLVRPGILSSRVTFSRAQTSATSTALAAGGAARWTEYGADTPRFAGSDNYLLIGGQRTTVSTRGRLIGGTGWSTTNATASLTTGPDGATTANRLDDGVAVSALHQAVPPSVAFVLGTSYSVSSIVKAETCTTCQLALGSGAFGSTAWCNFDISAGTVGTSGAGALSPRVVALGSGWFWISFTSVATVTASTQPGILLMTTSASAIRNQTYTGTNRTMLGYWSWVENSTAFPSSAILAASEPAVATRGQDNITIAFSQTVGSVLGSFALPYAASGVDQTLFEINDGTANNRIILRNVAGGLTIVAGRVVGGVLVAATSLDSMTADTLFRVGLTFDGSTITANFNGGTNQTVSGQPSGLTTLRIGNNAAGTSPMFGRIGYFDTKPYVIPSASLPSIVSAIP